jgi:hypothetical protein
MAFDHDWVCPTCGHGHTTPDSYFHCENCGRAWIHVTDTTGCKKSTYFEINGKAKQECVKCNNRPRVKWQKFFDKYPDLPRSTPLDDYEVEPVLAARRERIRISTETSRQLISQSEDPPLYWWQDMKTFGRDSRLSAYLDPEQVTPRDHCGCLATVLSSRCF